MDGDEILIRCDDRLLVYRSRTKAAISFDLFPLQQLQENKTRKSWAWNIIRSPFFLLGISHERHKICIYYWFLFHQPGLKGLRALKSAPIVGQAQLLWAYTDAMSLASSYEVSAAVSDRTTKKLIAVVRVGLEELPPKGSLAQEASWFI